MKARVLNPSKKKRKETAAERKKRMAKVRSYKKTAKKKTVKRKTVARKPRKKIVVKKTVRKRNPGLKVTQENKRFILRFLNCIYEESAFNGKVDIELTAGDRKKINEFIHFALK